ncbi:MAG: CMP-N-acetylneuraminic acid synthetase [Salibacteraceae bacterium]|jgi:CMP-N-acetylneuraminic acid synthetase
MKNGCYIVERNQVVKNKSLLSAKPTFYEVNSFSANEIKDINNSSIARDMISLFFRSTYDV